ncbi:MAG: SLC13 family permease [Gammaproteobacteria bacterium]|nr:SLC13 family permease [Gammaproteobacteria bacterium]NIM73213.1 SLC13 family permease [Gammaproteobacteria bacterium]NIN40049.1 SLC13 family permease [Gammaproteobacteria bacterium]NIO26263.1 SLC13 family permease [Gammaproteobacteria bacterium]NIO66072.1 SLC13 family permease [Gammaproteobacteria bacterium]
MTLPSARTRGVVVAGAAACVGIGAALGGDASMAVAAALTVLTIGLWATHSLPEHIVAVAFFVLAIVLSVAPGEVVLSGFLSSALWLVFGGLVLGAAVQRTGLGSWIASRMVDRMGARYTSVIAAVIVGNVVLGFLVPSGMARAVILVPIVVALSEQLGFARGDRGRTGMVVATAVCGYVVPATILPANLPNAVLLGAADTLYGVQITYGQYLLFNFPINGAVKAVLLWVLVCRLFPAQVGPNVRKAAVREKLSGEGRLLLFLLCGCLALWITDRWHGIAPGWISTGAAVICLLPRVNLVPPESFQRDVSLATLIYVAGILGLGAVVAHSGLGGVFAEFVLAHAGLDSASPGQAFAVLSLLSASIGLFATMPGIVAIMSPLAGDLAGATGLSLVSVLMTIVNGYTLVAFPYQVGPIVFALILGGERFRDAVRLMLPLLLVSAAALIPLTYLWWRLLGYLG